MTRDEPDVTTQDNRDRVVEALNVMREQLGATRAARRVIDSEEAMQRVQVIQEQIKAIAGVRE